MKTILFDVLKPLIMLIPLKIRISVFYYIKYRNFPNLNKPVLYSEKLQARKFKMEPIFSQLSDKYMVRQFVENKIGPKHLIKLYGVYERFDEINFNSLPNKFVIKTNFGSGADHLEIVTDKSSVCLTKLNNKFSKALSSSYIGAILGETQYDAIPKKIIIEEFIENDNNDLADFKFHLFNSGNGFLQIDFDRFTQHKRNIYDLSFNKLDFKLLFPSGEYQLPPGEQLNELKLIAAKLAEGFDYVRVDLYLVKGAVLFGEMTFTPGSGFEPFTPSLADKKYGVYWL